MFYLPEDPRAAYASPTDHYGVYAIVLETLLAYLGGSHVAIPDDRDLHARVIFYGTDQGPIRLARVHLRPCTSVDGEGGDTAVL